MEHIKFLRIIIQKEEE